MGYIMKKVDQFLARSFKKLGRSVALHPGYFILIPTFVTALCATGFERWTYEDDPEYLFAPYNGYAQYEKQVVEENFPVNYSSEFHPSRMSRFGRFLRVIIMAADNETLLRSDVWDEALLVDNILQNVTVEHSERTYTYKDLCALFSQKCWDNQILEVGELFGDLNSLTYPFMLNSKTLETYLFDFYFGGISLSDHGTIQSAKALTLYYFLKFNDQQDSELGIIWEKKSLEKLTSRKFEKIVIAYYTSRTLADELERNTTSVIPFFVLTVGLVTAFCVINDSMADCVKSKTFLGLAAVLCALMSCVSAFGFLLYCGIPFIGINLAAPFLMLGIGIDDSFVMLASWRRTDVHLPVPERLALTFEDAAVSITITSLTDTISFFIGTYTNFPSMQIFCLYTGMSSLMTYLWHISLFGGCLAIAGYAERKQKHNMTCFKVQSYSQSKEANKSCWYRWCCSGGVRKDAPQNPRDNKEHTFMRIFRDYIAVGLNKPIVKVLVLLVFLVYICIAVWGCTTLKEGLEKSRLARYDSYSATFYDLEDRYFRQYPYRLQVVITGDHNYSNPTTQQSLLNLMTSLENHTNVANYLYTESWLRSWLEYVNVNGEQLNISTSTEESFIKNLKEYYLSDTTNPYTLDVKFVNNRIAASRFVIQAFNVSNTEADKNLMVELREICRNSGVNATIFNPLYIFFDQFTMVRSTTLQDVTIAAVIMIVMALIFIPNPLCCIWVTFSIISIEIGVIGYMSFWGVNLDSISMVQLIMCIGFSVDFSAHITYAYLCVRSCNPDERVKESLYAIGFPILQGGCSTIIGVFALVFAPSYIFITFFKTVFLVIFLGMLHGIFLLPVLLSILGPGACRSTRRFTLSTNSLLNSAVLPTNHKFRNKEQRVELTSAEVLPQVIASLPTPTEDGKDSANLTFTNAESSIYFIATDKLNCSEFKSVDPEQLYELHVNEGFSPDSLDDTTSAVHTSNDCKLHTLEPQCLDQWLNLNDGNISRHQRLNKSFCIEKKEQKRCHRFYSSSRTIRAVQM